ncbi:MAG: DUF4199 domain-containing protein [Opitutaceae bacterium]|nr:DUF4199 domain-containing protein [Opitutaceae bacterium]
MKPYVTYGIGIAVAGALLTLALFFMGVHNDVEKMQSTGSIAGWLTFAIAIIGVVLAIRATRNGSPDGGLTYGRGVLTALLVGVVAGVLGAVFNYVYTAIINPGMVETLREMQVAALEGKGLNQQQIDAAEGVMKIMTSPVVTSAMALLMTPIFYTIVGLIASIFLKREPVAPPAVPPAAA